MAAEESLYEVRCKTCGTMMGYRRTIGEHVHWCSQVCANTFVTKAETEVRDEVVVELYLSGQGVSAIAREVSVSYQMVQQILARRGVTSLDREGVA